MNKVNVEKISKNQLSLVTPIMELGRANVRTLDKKSLLDSYD